MSAVNKINLLDEALRILWLESIPKADEETCNKELNLILSESNGLTMDAEKQKQLIDKLFETVKGISLGELISQAITTENIPDLDLAAQTGLTLNSVKELREDAVFPNNIPVLLFQRFLERLHISFQSVEQSIWKTFEILKRKDFIDSCPGYVLARKSRGEIKDGLQNRKASGREFHQDKESLEKYLIKLKELMEKKEDNGS
jgi:hypothetical protein